MYISDVNAKVSLKIPIYLIKIEIFEKILHFEKCCAEKNRRDRKSWLCSLWLASAALIKQKSDCDAKA